MVALAVLAGLILAFLAGAAAQRADTRRLAAISARQALNVFGDVVLPEPDDPRWGPKKGKCIWNKCTSPNSSLVLGAIEVCPLEGTTIENMTVGWPDEREVNRNKEYALAVRKAYMAQRAAEIIESHDPTLPPAPERLLLSGV